MNRYEPDHKDYAREIDDLPKRDVPVKRKCACCDKPVKCEWGKVALCDECDEHFSG